MTGIEVIRNVPGVYLFVDLDDRPLYAGQSRTLRSRLQQHVVRQDSSVTADGLLDLYEVRSIYVWYCSDEQLRAYESAIHSQFRPRWNRATVPYDGATPALNVQGADACIGVMDSLEQLAVRRQPLERIEARLLHLLRGVRKAKVSGASGATRAALALHVDELAALVAAIQQPVLRDDR